MQNKFLNERPDYSSKWETNKNTKVVKVGYYIGSPREYRMYIDCAPALAWNMHYVPYDELRSAVVVQAQLRRYMHKELLKKTCLLKMDMNAGWVYCDGNTNRCYRVTLNDDIRFERYFPDEDRYESKSRLILEQRCWTDLTRGYRNFAQNKALVIENCRLYISVTELKSKVKRLEARNDYLELLNTEYLDTDVESEEEEDIMRE